MPRTFENTPANRARLESAVKNKPKGPTNPRPSFGNVAVLKTVERAEKIKRILEQPKRNNYRR